MLKQLLARKRCMREAVKWRCVSLRSRQEECEHRSSCSWPRSVLPALLCRSKVARRKLAVEVATLRTILSVSATQGHTTSRSSSIQRHLEFVFQRRGFRTPLAALLHRASICRALVVSSGPASTAAACPQGCFGCTAATWAAAIARRRLQASEAA